MDKRLWTLPETATKADRKHIVPLSTLAAEVLGNIPHTDPVWVFSLTRGKHIGSFGKGKANLDNAVKMLMAGLSETQFAALTPKKRTALPSPEAWRWHDLRRSAAAWMRRELGISRDTVDEILNHDLGEVSETYQPEKALPEMRRALEAWARLLRLIINEEMWAKASEVLHGDDYDKADEFRYAIRGDVDTWERYVERLTTGRVSNVVELATA